MMKYKNISVSKPTKDGPCEDSSRSSERFIAVSDGAGGYGLFADKWSECLVSGLDSAKPIESFDVLDSYIECVWKPFYDKYEAVAKESDSFMLNKFYEEGSCATLAALWIEKDMIKWMAYGDSVVFIYNKNSDSLNRSFGNLSAFTRNPDLISCSEPLSESAFTTGNQEKQDGDICLIASDALSHYIMMMYMCCHKNEYGLELEEASSTKDLNGDLVRHALQEPDFNFYTDIIVPLIESTGTEESFERYMTDLRERGLLDSDDYSLSYMLL